MGIVSILKKHRIAASLGAAVVVVPLAGLPLVNATDVYAASQNPQTTSSDAPVNAGISTSMSEGSVAPIVSADKPAVVTITSHMSGGEGPAAMRGHGGRGGPPSMPFDDFMRRFFGDQGQPFGQMPFPQQQPDRQMTALGSGFIIDKNGTIVTNNHVVEGGKDIKVILDDGTELSAKVLGRDAKSDLAVLKVDAAHDLPVIQWGDSEQISLGDRVIAIGNPFGIGTTVTEGIVSARGRDLNGGPYDDFIQVDAAINRGNSGGPLVAMNGKVVGIDSAIYSPNGGNVGVGFAIPSDEAKSIVQRLIEHGSIAHGYIGVEIQPVTDDIKNALGLDNKKGALVASVGTDTPADRARIKSGDIIKSIGDKEIEDPRDLARAVADMTPGTTANVKVIRKGEEKYLTVTVGDMKNATELAGNGGNDQSQQSEGGATVLGMQLGDLTAQTRDQLNLPDQTSGVLVEDVDPQSAAGDDGMEAGDVIVSVNQEPVKTPHDVRSAVQKAKSHGRSQVLLLVAHGDHTSFVALPVADEG